MSALRFPWTTLLSLAVLAFFSATAQAQSLQSSWTGANAAHRIWEALGIPDRMGYSLTTEHGHCSFPASQQAEMNAYVQKFLIGGGSGNTNVMRNDPGVPFNQGMWINWTTPALSGGL